MTHERRRRNHDANFQYQFRNHIAL
jgi:hypothetical protein